jgi:hypothetical protein
MNISVAMMLRMGVDGVRYLADGMKRKDVLQKLAESVWRFSDQVNIRLLGSLGPAMAIAWAESAFALLEPSHRLAASLMATSIPTDAPVAPEMPWRCFAIAVPSGLLRQTPSFPEPSHVFVLRSVDGEEVKTLQVCAEGGVVEYGSEKSLLSYADLGDMSFNSNDMLVSDKELLSRRATLIGRLIVGVCVELDSPLGDSAKSSRPSMHRTKRGEPTPWTFKLTRDVRVDVRQAVSDYACGIRRSSPTVQVLVRGHHKRQPHGKGGLLRKWVHIEPYWRGPEDAPIGVRSHRLGESK